MVMKTQKEAFCLSKSNEIYFNDQPRLHQLNLHLYRYIISTLSFKDKTNNNNIIKCEYMQFKATQQTDTTFTYSSYRKYYNY